LIVYIDSRYGIIGPTSVNFWLGGVTVKSAQAGEVSAAASHAARRALASTSGSSFVEKLEEHPGNGIRAVRVNFKRGFLRISGIISLRY